MKLLDGKAVAEKIQKDLREVIANTPGRKPCLAVVMVGEHPPSQLYVKRKREACAEAGIVSILRELPPTISEESLLQEIAQLNQDDAVDGILVQLPLPAHIRTETIVTAISPKKDVDGFHPYNLGKVLIGDRDAFVPCTPLGIQTLLEHYKIEVAGKHVVIVGRSTIVGKPMAALLMQNHPFGNATVTVVHRHTQDLHTYAQMADILIVAVGKAKFVTKEMVKEGAVVIDVGINRGEGNKIVGDVAFEEVKERCSAITPVPGGVGPMTIAMLLFNTVKSFQQND